MCDIVNVTISNNNQVNIGTLISTPPSYLLVTQRHQEIYVKGAHSEITLTLKPSEIPAISTNSTVERRREDCWWTGSVLGEADSTVSLTLCDGLVIVMFTSIYFFLFLSQPSFRKHNLGIL